MCWYQLFVHCVPIKVVIITAPMLKLDNLNVLLFIIYLDALYSAFHHVNLTCYVTQSEIYFDVSHILPGDRHIKLHIRPVNHISLSISNYYHYITLPNFDNGDIS